MLVSPKTSGKIYVTYTIVTALCLAFFFSSPYLFGEDHVSRSVNYNVICSHNDYDVKISGAYYSEGICAFTFKCKTKRETVQTYPDIQKVTFDNLSAEYAFETGGFIDDYSRIVTVYDVPEDFAVMKITIYSKGVDTVHDDSYNEFGELVEGYTEEGTTYVMTITVDKNDMSEVVVEPETAQNIDENSDASSVSDSLTNEIESDNDFFATTEAVTAVQDTESYAAQNDSSSAESETVTSKTATETEQTVNQNTQNNAETSVSAAATAAQTQAQTQTVTTATSVTTTTKQTASTGTTTTKTTAKSETTTTTTTASETATKLSVSGGDITLNAGETAVLTVNIEPAEAKTSLVWLSNKPDIASVSGGKVTAVSSGKAIITVTDKASGLTASCMITVN